MNDIQKKVRQQLKDFMEKLGLVVYEHDFVPDDGIVLDGLSAYKHRRSGSPNDIFYIRIGVYETGEIVIDLMVQDLLTPLLQESSNTWIVLKNDDAGGCVNLKMAMAAVYIKFFAMLPITA